MSAEIDTMLYVGEVPWHGLGHHYEVAPTTPAEIVAGAELNWTVAAAPMKTDLHTSVLNYNTIYREDTNRILGVVNKPNIELTQNSDMFNAFGELIGSEVTTETAASLGVGTTVFGCFKISDTYKLLDDDVDHYLVVVNDHLKCDGKITVINTPIRVVCQNTLNAAIGNNKCLIRIPITASTKINVALAEKILKSVGSTMDRLKLRAEKLVSEKITRNYIDRVLDELFPYIEVKEGETSTHDRANEKVDMMRDVFVNDCLGAANLSNYSNTKYQVLNAVLDFSQHYFLNMTKSYDLKYRMGSVFGSSDSTQPIGTTSKFMKIMDRIAA